MLIRAFGEGVGEGVAWWWCWVLSRREDEGVVVL